MIQIGRIVCFTVTISSYSDCSVLAINVHTHIQVNLCIKALTTQVFQPLLQTRGGPEKGLLCFFFLVKAVHLVSGLLQRSQSLRLTLHCLQAHACPRFCCHTLRMSSFVCCSSSSMLYAFARPKTCPQASF